MLQMGCGVDSGLVIVLFIIFVLLWVVGMLLFYGHIDHSCASVNNISMVRILKRESKKNYETLDICPKWVYPTYLVL